jgi:TadE-like protein
MTLSHMKARWRVDKRRGLAAVELAMLLPLLIFCAMAVVDFARLIYAQVTLQNCARNGALYEFYAKSGFSLPSTWTSLSNAATADASNLTVGNITASASTPGLSTNNYVTVTVSYPYTLTSLSSIGGSASFPGSITLTQTATMPYPASASATVP